MEEYYLICEDSLEGIFTGVYDAYLWKQPLERVHLLTREEDNYRLFAQYQNCVPDQEKTKKVAARVMKTFGMEAYFSLCEVAASHEEDKAEAILRTIVHGLSDKLGFTLLNDLRDPGVYRTFVMARNVGKEIHFVGTLSYTPDNEVATCSIATSDFPVLLLLLYEKKRQTVRYTAFLYQKRYT